MCRRGILPARDANFDMLQSCFFAGSLPLPHSALGDTGYVPFCSPGVRNKYKLPPPTPTPSTFLVSAARLDKAKVLIFLRQTRCQVCLRIIPVPFLFHYGELIGRISQLSDLFSRHSAAHLLSIFFMNGNTSCV